MATAAAAIAGAGLALALPLLLLSAREDGDTERRPLSKEEAARASFRVRRSQLMSIAGRGRPADRRRRGRAADARDERRRDDERLSWLCWLMSSLARIVSHAAALLSFGRPRSAREIAPKEEAPPSRQQHGTSQNDEESKSAEHYYGDAAVVGLDCEMVGGGRGGWKSLLARCSVVTLDRVPSERDDVSGSGGLARDLVVLYDKYVVPRERITDYRTEWSGITKDTYSDRSGSAIPVVSFHQCQNEVSRLFSSLGGRRVVVVGHALENDFEALEIEVRVGFGGISSLFYW